MAHWSSGMKPQGCDAAAGGATGGTFSRCSVVLQLQYEFTLMHPFLTPGGLILRVGISPEAVILFVGTAARASSKNLASLIRRMFEVRSNRIRLKT